MGIGRALEDMAVTMSEVLLSEGTVRTKVVSVTTKETMLASECLNWKGDRQARVQPAVSCLLRSSLNRDLGDVLMSRFSMIHDSASRVAL